MEIFQAYFKLALLICLQYYKRDLKKIALKPLLLWQNTKKRFTKKKPTAWKKTLNQKVSFFTGSLVLITAFTVAASAIPSYKQENQSSLEVLFASFIEDADLTQAHIEAENFRIEIYKKELRRAQAAQNQAAE